jgi:hypothetical protein
MFLHFERLSKHLPIYAHYSAHRIKKLTERQKRFAFITKNVSFHSYRRLYLGFYLFYALYTAQIIKIITQNTYIIGSHF